MSSADDYDRFPYASHAFAQSHPQHLAMLARLFGMQPPAVSTARVLELGCAGGGNLLPMAEAMPQARFVGVDFAARHIAEASANAEALGLGNIEFVQADIAELDAALGNFDYLICHGVYSWVTPAVQAAILDIAARRLHPGGVAYVSYNTYPGWHMRGMVRDMMLYHTKAIEDPATRVAEARGLLDFLSANVDPRGSAAYHTLLGTELQALRGAADAYLRHEHLSTHNSALYFHEFMARAGEHGLQYLAEADLPSMILGNLPQAVQEPLRKVAPDILRMEQYMDFLRNRSFRQTLLVDAAAPLRRNLRADALDGLLLRGRLTPVEADAGADGDAPTRLRSASGIELGSRDPALLALLRTLREAWPAALPVAALLGEHAAGGDAGTEALASQVLRCVCSGALELRTLSVPGVIRPGERPLARASARLQARRGKLVSNLCHQTLALDDLGRQLLMRLDGDQDRSALIASIAALAEAGELRVAVDGQPLSDPAGLRRVLPGAVDRSLAHLAEQALLLA